MPYENPWFQLSPDLFIDIVGQVRDVNPHPHRSGAPYWVLVLVEKGRRTLYADGRPLCADARDFLLIPPNSLQEPMETDDHAAFYVHFHSAGSPTEPPQHLEASRLLLPMHGHLPADFDCFAHMRYLHDQFLKPYAGKTFCAVQLLALLHAISLHAQRSKLWLSDGSSMVERLIAFIETHADKPMRAEDYESAFSLSYHQLSAVFKRQFGCTLKQHHQHIRMRRAAALLLSGKTAQQTAQMCGYEDYYFFIRCFKSEHGVAPGIYLKRNGVE